MIIGADASIIERADIQSDQPAPLPDAAGLATVNETEPQIAMLLSTNSVAAVIKLRGYDNAYLSIIRPLDPRVVAHLRETQATVSDFANLQSRRFGVQLAFALMYTVIALAVLLSAAWLGLNFANRLVAPIRRLIGAANIVSTGNLYVQVPVLRSEGDLGQLGETFNRMTYELRTQRDDIVRARDVIDQRRRFTEAVLAGASAGVIGVDGEGRISILNRSAEKLVDRLEADVIGHPLSEILPELKEIFTNAQSGIQRLVQGQVTISRQNRERNLSVRVTTEQSPDSERGYVITLDDITELVTAQRTSAWADIARRIAHEIKNPLTPIQLSAERLRRKYGKTITDDPAVFYQCTDTIVRQVDDIKRMVDEFSKFARMPKAVIAAEDVADTVRQVVFLHARRQRRHRHRSGAGRGPDAGAVRPPADLAGPDQHHQERNARPSPRCPQTERGRGRIRVTAAREGDDIFIDVIDNGIGLPKENRNRLLEPYVTTREKGTGLGLAIVGRILEEHGGGIELRDASEKFPGERGAWMRLHFLDERADCWRRAPTAQTAPMQARNRQPSH